MKLPSVCYCMQTFIYELLLSEAHLCLVCYDNAIGCCAVHELLQSMFFTAFGTLVTSGGELYSDDELRRLGNQSCNDTLLIALKPTYI